MTSPYSISPSPVPVVPGNISAGLPGADGRKKPKASYDSPDGEPPIKELGSSFSYNQFFSGQADGLLFSYGAENVTDLKRMIDTDGNAASVEQLLSFPIIAAPWEIKGKKGDKGEAEFIEKMYSAGPENGGMRIPIEQVIAQMTWAMTIKRVFFELCYTVSDLDPKHPYIYDKIAWRPPETCEIALNPSNSEIVGFRQAPIMDYTYGVKSSRQKTDKNGWIPMYGDKAFVYVHGQWRNPIDGYSSMQVPYWCWVTKQKIRYLWYQFLEQNALPKTVVKNPDEEKAREDAKKVATLRSRDVVGLEDSTIIETLESAGHGASQFLEAIMFLDNEMSAAIVDKFSALAGNGATGAGGSYALSQNLIALYLRIRRFVARDIAKNITNKIHGPIIRHNFGRDAVIPEFVFGPLNEANEDSILTMFSAITQTTQAGQLPKEFLNQLTVRVSNILELDPVKVKAQIDEMNKDIDPNDPLGLVVGTVQATTAMMQQAAQAQPLQPIASDPSIPKPPGSGQNSPSPNQGVNHNTFNQGNNPVAPGSTSVANGGGKGPVYGR